MMNAMKRGFRLWCRHWADSLAYIVINTAVVLMCAVPMLGLFSGNSTLHYLAFLTPVLYLLLALPFRRNAAWVLQRTCKDDGAMNDMALVSFVDYDAKLCHALLRGLYLLLWAIPGIAATVYAVYMYKGGSDSITIVMSINKLGGRDLIRGLEYLLLIYLACWLPLCAGLMVHSGARHAWASGRHLSKRGFGTLCLTWLCSLLILVPFLIAAVVILKQQLPPILKLFKMIQIEAAFALLPPMGLQLLIAFALLVLPLVPLRHLMIAAVYADEGDLMP